MAIELEETGTFTIGELAGAVGVNVQTVRYYERRGLLPKPKRRASGYREYLATDVARLEFIRRAQALGFTLSEIEQLLALRVDPRTTPEDVHRAVIDGIDAAIVTSVMTPRTCTAPSKRRSRRWRRRSGTSPASAARCARWRPPATCTVHSETAPSSRRWSRKTRASSR